MADPTLVEQVERRIAKAQRARDAISGHGGSASGYPEDVVTLSLEEAVALVAEVRRLEEQVSLLQESNRAICALSHRYGNPCLEFGNGKSLPQAVVEFAQSAAFRAGAEQMREAAAQAADTWYFGKAESRDEANQSPPARAIRALPVPPAPSPAHDGKEGA